MNEDINHGNLSYSSAQDRMSYIPNYYKWIFKKFSKYLYGSIIDVGCGAGHLVHQYLTNKHIQNITLVDKDKECLAAIKDKYEKYNKRGKIKIINSDIIYFLEEQKKDSAENIIMLDVLEHFKNDFDLIRIAHNALKQKGKIILKVPAGPSLYCNIDVKSGHYRRYDFQQLQKLMEDTGFKVLSLSYMNPLGRLVYKKKSNKKHNSNFSKSFSSGMLQTINITMILLPFIDMLNFKGLSLIGVFEKK